ncbi:MAG: UDP-N-acetylglucosamine--N-acetylmuramyl-(pentapeptide) pyrophosphoryl-undecaprenol N-acetylglucosamine transferase, partial [Candidatus Saccharimonadales bacterium]
VIFIKGGFVGVPVGLMAALRGIPYVTHDSDAVPGLANRIIARWAAVHTVALPKSAYTYPANRTHSVGVPVNSSFRKVTKDVQAEYRRQLSLKPEYQVVFITGGGMGALRLNEAVVEAVSPLLKVNPKLFVIHASGRAHEGVTEQLYSQKLNGEELQRVMVRGFFIDDLYKHSGAADVIITRAGATNLAEFASQQKCCIIVPNPQLTGGHQSKNAQYLAENKAAIVLPDEDVVRHPKILADTLTRLLSSPSQRRTLANNLGSFAKPRAAKELAQILLETVA